MLKLHMFGILINGGTPEDGGFDIIRPTIHKISNSNSAAELTLRRSKLKPESELNRVVFKRSSTSAFSDFINSSSILAILNR